MQLHPDQTIVNLFLSFIFAATIFVYGFFPVSFKSGNFASLDDLPDVVHNVPLNTFGYRPRHSHSVLMVIDAMRYDFTTQHEMKYSTKLLKSEDACLFRLNVQPPTVTLPRIKAMITGTVPNFIDVVLNLGNSELKTDSIVHQLLAKNEKISFCGDNTWVKMFPNKFHRQLENMDSLFVNDFYEGDKNITHRLESELKSADWDLLILHYLGLDHIGHVEGPKSSKIHSKLQEMDNVIMRIHLEILEWKKRLKLPPLFLITGDHGMRDTGGHGGSTYGEVNVPLMVVGVGCRQSDEIYQQIDIAPTVSVLLGLPIPDSSIGSLIVDMLVDLSYEDQLYALRYNSDRLLKMISEKIPQNQLEDEEFFVQLTEAKVLHAKFLRKTENLEVTYRRCRLLYSSSSRAMSDLLATFFAKYDQASIAVGVLLMTATCAVLMRFVMSEKFSVPITVDFTTSTAVSILVLSVVLKYLICELTDCSLCFTHWITFVIFMVIVTVTLFLVMISRQTTSLHIPSTFCNSKLIWFLVFAILFHTVSLASSSFVEEEHQTWYYITHTFLFTICIMSFKKRQSDQWLLNADLLKIDNRKKRSNARSFIEQYFFEFIWFILLKFLLLGRRLNQTGDKWLSLPDIGDFLMMEQHRFWNSCFVVISLCAMIYKLTEFNGTLTNVLTFTAAVLIYYYRTLSGSVYFAGIKPSESYSSITIFWLNILEIACINYVPIFYKYLKKTHSKADIQSTLGVNVTMFCIVSALLHKPHNIFLNFLILLTCGMVNASCNQLFGGRTNLFVKVVGHFWIGKMFFFYQGNSNSLASIDLNAGYVGLQNFNFYAVGAYLTLNTFNGLILTHFVLLYYVFDEQNNDRSKSDIPYAMGLISCLVILPFTFYAFVAIWFQSHIFIWTVFSPKLIYEFYHLVLVSFLILFTRIFHKFVN